MHALEVFFLGSCSSWCRSSSCGFAGYVVYRLFQGPALTRGRPPAHRHPVVLVPLSWLIGRWEGAGVLGHPARGETDTRFGQVVEFSHDGRDFLRYSSTTWALGRGRPDHRAARRRDRVLAAAAGRRDSPAPADGPRSVELE